MLPTGAFIDTNLLILLLVGSIDRTLVGKHKRTRNFVPEDHDRLVGLVDSLDRVFVTPNTLTEASNLLHGDGRLMKRLQFLIHHSEEIYVESKVAANHRKFRRIGLTDTVLLESISEERPLITVDFDLYGAASAKGEKVAYNFTHWQVW